MARQAVNLSQSPENVAAVQVKKTRDGRKAKLADKSFEVLTAKQKDHLLKTLALRAGLISESED
jgi:hypothetical protein